MRSKYQLAPKLLNLLKKYCNADYGFDHQSTKNGVFQYYLLKLLIILSSDYATFLELLQKNVLDYLSQVAEEAIMYSYEEGKIGNTKHNDEYL